MRPIYLISKTPFEGVIHIPILSIRFLHPAIDFSSYDGIVITSKQGVEALKSYSEAWKELVCVCVSEPTARFAAEAGATQIVHGSGYGESIPDILHAMNTEMRWLYARPEKVASDWVAMARNAGLHVDEAVVYQTECTEGLQYDEIEQNGVLVFTSPSSVSCFLKKEPILPTQRVVVIGKITCNALPDGITGYISEDQSVGSAIDMARKIAADD